MGDLTKTHRGPVDITWGGLVVTYLKDGVSFNPKALLEPDSFDRDGRTASVVYHEGDELEVKVNLAEHDPLLYELRSPSASDQGGNIIRVSGTPQGLVTGKEMILTPVNSTAIKLVRAPTMVPFIDGEEKFAVGSTLVQPVTFRAYKAEGSYLYQIEYGAADGTPPTATLTPADGATAIDKTANLTAVFNEEMISASCTDPLNTTLLEEGTSTPVPHALTYDAATKTLTVNPTSDLTGTTWFHLHVEGQMDVSGNRVVETNSRFQTAA